MFSETLEELIEIAISEGELTDKNRQILCKRAVSEGIDIDEFEMVLDMRLAKQKKKLGVTSAPPVAPVAPAPAPQPTNQKFGGVNKCPACGSIVESGSVKCHECGHTFVNVSGNNSVQRLSDILREIEARHQNTGEKKGMGGFLNNLGRSIGLFDSGREEEICTAINTFPIPNSKEDLIEFICFLKPKAELAKKTGEPIYIAYNTKYEECLSKAGLFLSEDPQFELLLQQNGIKIGKKKLFGLF